MDVRQRIVRGRWARWLGTILVMLVSRGYTASAVDYTRDIKPVFKARCYACHGSIKQEAGLRVDTAAAIHKGGDSGAAVRPRKPMESLLLQRVLSRDKTERMPADGDPLTERQIEMLRAWIAKGAPQPQGEVGQADPKTHWAFRPIESAKLRVTNSDNAIDFYVDRALNKVGLSRNPPADARTLVHRMFFDMHGLPPDPRQIDIWTDRIATDDGRLDAKGIEQLVDHLLGSSRYGERWAQHWLDVVRYADTHGFEVNTPRPNAWPYRDYVIRALNDDKPYDQFVMDQIVGDARAEGAATGFLVAAPVLLPGQIGKDEASKRQARQDSLDEIVVGTSATFLGLTVGCARCHDHKFDPITQRDYYSMQAFFAGVDYGDRKFGESTRVRQQQRVAALTPRLDALKRRLQFILPPAVTARTIIIDDEDSGRVTVLKTKVGHGGNPGGQQRGYRDDPGSANRVANLSRGRYTYWRHKPGEDVFTWNPATEGKFRIWVSWGAHGSGVHTRDARYLLDQDGRLETREDQTEIARVDQYYFANVTSGTSEKKPLWSGLHDAGVHRLTRDTRLVLRGGDTETVITADVVVLQETNESQKDQRLPRLREPVDAKLNVERFEKIPARFVRFHVLSTINDNRREPCLDELEVFAAGSPSTNVALASKGAKATSSGNNQDQQRHRLEHINDGRYGNGHSWISSQVGRGWVQIELAREHIIDRIEWARDRNGEFVDRLAVQYYIEVSRDGKRWTTVARSDDRVPRGTPHDAASAILRYAPKAVSEKLAGDLAEFTRLRKRRADLQQAQTVYGGVFRTPDKTRILHRGDPEQPREHIAPRVPEIFGELTCSINESEQNRRAKLAGWIASRKNPLTARVMVNRVWQWHFGRGLVDSASDFGLNGSRPSHPELLDRLAHDFIAGGWSIKRLHCQILYSATFQQSGRIVPAAKRIDADCRLMWRFPSRRLEAEAIRDSILAVSGKLNLKMGGPGFDFFKTRGGLSGFPPVEDFGPNQLRRMIYAHRIRMELVPVFGAFDCPDAGQAAPQRTRSTTAIQALNLFNSKFVVRQSQVFADRVRREVGNDAGRGVERAWRLALGRQPTRAEAAAAMKTAREHGLQTVCRVLLNCNEFLFIP